jgi:hypothetical protein
MLQPETAANQFCYYPVEASSVVYTNVQEGAGCGSSGYSILYYLDFRFIYFQLLTCLPENILFNSYQVYAHKLSSTSLSSSTYLCKFSKIRGKAESRLRHMKLYLSKSQRERTYSSTLS